MGKIIAEGTAYAGERLLDFSLMQPGELEDCLIASLPVVASASAADNELRARLTKAKLAAIVNAKFSTGSVFDDFDERTRRARKAALAKKVGSLKAAG